MHRPTIGALAVLLLLGTAGLWWLEPTYDERDAWLAAMFRVGLLMAVLWLAQPDLARLPRWVVLTALLLGLFFLRQPRALVLLIVAAVVVAAVQARQRSRVRRA